MSKREGKPGEAGVEGEGEGVGIGEGEGEGEAIGEEGEGEGEGKEGVVAFGSAMIYSITTFTFENEKRMGIQGLGREEKEEEKGGPRWCDFSSFVDSSMDFSMPDLFGPTECESPPGALHERKPIHQYYLHNYEKSALHLLNKGSQQLRLAQCRLSDSSLESQAV